MWTDLFFAAVFGVGIILKFRHIESQRAAFQEKTETKLADFNVRLIDLETDKNTVVEKSRDDIMDIPHSWLSQVAAAERGEGVRV